MWPPSRAARSPARRAHRPPARGGPGLQDSMGDRSNHSNLSVIRIPSNFCQNSCEFARIHEKFRYFKTVHHFLEDSAKFRENFIKIDANFNETFEIFCDFRDFQIVFVDFFTDFDEIFSEFRQIS